MDLDRLARAFFERPIYQRLFLAFTLGLFISCSVHVRNVGRGTLTSRAY